MINLNPKSFSKGLEVTFFEYLVEDGDSFQVGVLNGHGILQSSLVTVWSISEATMNSRTRFVSYKPMTTTSPCAVL